MTPRGPLSTLRPMRKPRRKTAAAASTHVGQTGRSGDAAAPKPDPETAAEQVERAPDRRAARSEDLAAVEERERDGEREQHERGRDCGARTAGEDRRGRRRRPGRDRARRTRLQSVLPPNAPVAPASHLPGDLRARSMPRDAAGRVLDDDLGDLTGLSRPGLHDPCSRSAGRKSPRSSGRAGSGRATLRPSDGPSAISTSPRASDSSGGLGIRSPPQPGLRKDEGERESGDRGARSAARSERPELIADEVDRRDEHDRDRLRDDLAEPERDEQRGARRGSRASAIVETTRNRIPWYATPPALGAERPEPVPRVVVRHGDEERADRSRDVVEPEHDERAARRPRG